MDLRLLVVFVLAAALRYGLALNGFDGLFGQRVEVSTPAADFLRLQEGVFLHHQGLSPYATAFCHEPPLLLAVWHWAADRLPAVHAFVAVDLLCALLLHSIARRFVASGPEAADLSERVRAVLPLAAALLYLFNPLAIAACVGQSPSLISNAAVLLALLLAQAGSVLAALPLALAAYLSIYPLQLLLPLCLVSRRSPLLLVLLFAASVAGLFYWSAWWLGSWQFIDETYLFVLAVRDLTPNIGLFWYFFTEVFSHFRSYFLFAFQLHCFAYAVPIAIRLHSRPMLQFWLLVAINSTFKAFPSVADLALETGLLVLFAPLLSGFPFQLLVIGQMFVFSGAFAWLAWETWIFHGSGNANFYYGANLALCAAQSWLIVETVRRSLSEDHERKHPPAPASGKEDQPAASGKEEQRPTSDQSGTQSTEFMVEANNTAAAAAHS